MATKYTFIVSDETINSYGFSVLTAGIDTTHFEKHPIMYYMHNRETGIIGRWENIRKDGNILFADAVFDNSSELANKVKQQVENGFLRGASIGIDNIEKEIINGVDTVTKCRLIEISIVDIPSNENAVKLYKRSGGFVYKLADLDETTDEDLKEALKKLLDLEKNASNDEILQAFKNAIAARNKDLCMSIDKAVYLGYIDPTQKDIFSSLAKTDPKAFNRFITLQKNKGNEVIKQLLDTAETEGKILTLDRKLFTEIADKNGIATIKRLLSIIPTPTSLTHILQLKDKGLENWTLSDYRKYAPETLKNNPELINTLLAKEKNTPVARSLEWYRKNDPETLKDNPELYKVLTNNK